MAGEETPGMDDREIILVPDMPGINVIIHSNRYVIDEVVGEMLTAAQTLIILGLVFEFLSVLISVRKLFSGYYDRLQKGTFREQIRKERLEGFLIILFLIIGMALQILSLQQF